MFLVVGLKDGHPGEMGAKPSDSGVSWRDGRDTCVTSAVTCRDVVLRHNHRIKCGEKVLLRTVSTPLAEEWLSSRLGAL